MSDSNQLIQHIQALASAIPDFSLKRGPGLAGGNGFTNRFKSEVDAFAKTMFGSRCQNEYRFIPGCNSAVDYYFPDEGVFIELALSLQNSLSEFEKDILKAALAKRSGVPIDRLVLIGKRGSINRHSGRASREIMGLLLRDYGIRVEIVDLP